MLLRLVGAMVAVLLALVGVTFLALESGGVATLETRDPAGAIRSTHVWYVEHDGELWVEAGAPENGWFVDVQHDPHLTFRSETWSGRCLARPSPSRDVHSKLRARLAEKYGWRDKWVGALVDSSRSSAVLLEREEGVAGDATSL